MIGLGTTTDGNECCEENVNKWIVDFTGSGILDFLDGGRKRRRDGFDLTYSVVFFGRVSRTTYFC